jgi:hypothetical protein
MELVNATYIQPITWVYATGNDELLPNIGYFAAAGNEFSFPTTLPKIGDIFSVVSDGSGGGFTINADGINQIIKYNGNVGSVLSSPGGGITLVCYANLSNNTQLWVLNTSGQIITLT